MQKKVVVFLPSLAGGGAERVTITLAAGLVNSGYRVRLVVGTARGALTADVPPELPLDDLAAPRALFAAPRLLRYLRRERPDVVISAISHASIIAAFVVRLGVPGCRLIVVHHNTTSLSTRLGRRRDRLVPLLCGIAYRLADRVLAVSRGVAGDLARSSHLPPARIQVMPNPIEYDRIRLLGQQPVPTDTVPDGEDPLIVAAGRMTAQKGFDVLLGAFAATTQPCRLVILGEGELRDELEMTVRRLGLQDRVRMPGFTTNPYPYFRAAQILVLSSRWEGLPTVLVEALAFPLRIVSTDCRSGPDEILTGVDGAELVPVDDVDALAAALDRALAAGPRTDPREEWRRYDAPHITAEISAVVEAVTSRG